MQKPIPTCVWLFYLLTQFLTIAQAAEPRYELTSYTSGDQSFSCYIFKPEGNGPFPAVIWNHGHAKNLLQAGKVFEYYPLARLFVEKGYVLFVPDRHMHLVPDGDLSSKSPVEAQLSEQEKENRRYRKYLDLNAKDVMAALAWVREQSYVDSKRVILSGWASGGMAALMAATFDRHVRGAVLFSPGCTQWQNKPLLKEIFRDTLKSCPTPVFLIQASNDSSIEPSEIALPIMEQKGDTYQVKRYAYAENSGQQKPSLAISGWQLWRSDVLEYLDVVTKTQPN